MFDKFETENDAHNVFNVGMRVNCGDDRSSQNCGGQLICGTDILVHYSTTW